MFLGGLSALVMHRRNYRTDVRAGDLSVCVVGRTMSVIVVDCLHGALRREQVEWDWATRRQGLESATFRTGVRRCSH